MTKLIKLSNGTTQMMSFEEVVEQFKPMVDKKIREHQLETVFNAVEEDDLRQHLLIHLWKSYEAYDITTGNCFSTVAFYGMKSGKREGTSKLYAKKRVNEAGTTSLDKELDENASLLDMVSYDVNFDQQLADKEIVSFLDNNLSDMEKDVLSMLIKESEGCRMDKKAFAERWNISRPTAAKRVKQIAENLQEMMLDAGYML
jgi:DNA-directed RNA polymerase specialized sigma subunit